MKRTIALMIALLCALQLSAQLTHTDKGAVDQTANAILKKASAKMSGTVSFTVTVVNLDADKKETFRQKVEVLYNAPRYRVKAGSMELYCDGKAVWQYNKPNKEVVVNITSPSGQSTYAKSRTAPPLSTSSPSNRGRSIR